MWECRKCARAAKEVDVGGRLDDFLADKLLNFRKCLRLFAGEDVAL